MLVSGQPATASAPRLHGPPTSGLAARVGGAAMHETGADLEEVAQHRHGGGGRPRRAADSRR